MPLDHFIGRAAASCALTLCALFSLVCAPRAHAVTLGQQAPLASVEFRAVGYGPRWLFEVDRRGEVRFRVDGANAIVKTGLSLGTRSIGVLYGASTETQELRAEILEVTCWDAISGEHLTHTVTIRLDGREFRGCGRGFRTGETADR